MLKRIGLQLGFRTDPYFIRRCIVDYSKHILTINFILLLLGYWAITE